MNATITNPVNLILIILGSFLGLSIGLFLLFNKSAKNKANVYLGALILVLTTYYIPAFFYRFDLLTQFPHIIGIHLPVGFLVGPLAYLYVRACTQKGFKIRPILWLNFLPFVLDIFIQMPIFLQSGPEKVKMYLNIVKEGTLTQNHILLVIKTLHGTIYFVLAVQIILKYREHLSNTASSIDTAFHRWVMVFLFILTFPILGLMGFVFNDFQKLLFMSLLLSCTLFILSVYFAALVKPELFHAFPHQMVIPESSEEQKQKYESSNLQEAQKEKYIKKLLAFMELENPYQSPELTLAELSEKVNIPAHYLSQIVNEKLDCNFLDFINGYRVKAAQEMLTNPKFSHFTILAIAYEAGFNSKSTFYATFKKVAGMTPSQYRKGKTVAV